MQPPDGGSRWAGASLELFAWRIAAGYALLAGLATALALALRDGLPWVYPNPWLTLGPFESVGWSVGLGAALAALLVGLTRFATPRFTWARRLHGDLRPTAHGLSAARIVVIALFSSLGEELLFRGLLQPWLGVLGAGLVFGLVHQIPGPSRWVWAGWATVVGTALGAIFALTGSLAGPLVAHALVNGLDLAYLRDVDHAAAERGAQGKG